MTHRVFFIEAIRAGSPAKKSFYENLLDAKRQAKNTQYFELIL
jgi:hypothetical protein